MSAARPAASAGWPVAIGEAAQRSGVSARMLRHYEALGLLGRVPRTEAGYRLYGEAEVHTLRFIKRARELGFAMAEIAELVDLWRDRDRASASVRRIAERHLAELATRVAALQGMQRTLQALLTGCHGDDRPECPILDDLAGQPVCPAAAGHPARPAARPTPAR